jgi:hypothetical protein
MGRRGGHDWPPGAARQNAEKDSMKQAALRWTMYTTAIFIAGPVAGAVVAGVDAPDGGPDASPLTGASPVSGLLRGLVAFAIAGGMGLATAWLTNTRAAMTTVGIILAWAAFRSGDAEVILRAAQSPSPLWRMAAEGAVFGVLGIALMLGLHALSQREHHESFPSEAPGLTATVRQAAAGPGVLAAVFVALVAGAGAAWLVANTGMKGQTVGAGMMAGLAGAALGRLVDNRAPSSVFLVPAALLAVAAPAAAALAFGAEIVETVNEGGLFPVARMTALDWIAGAFLGVPVGLGWTGSMVDKRA